MMKDKESEKMMEKEEAMMQADHVLITPNQVVWADAPASLPAGAKIAVLEGDPSKPGPFTLRVSFPANYRIAPHWHPAVEHVTVISGTFSLGMGETFDESKLEELPVGGFAVMQTGTRHFAWSRNGGVVQLHGIGPWALNYVNPEDDPRNK
jgi:quercetin dioxygenase-like cupin family protein